MGRVQLSSCGLLAPYEDVCLLLSGFDLVFCLTGTVSRYHFLQRWLEYEGPQHMVQSTHIGFLAPKRASGANGDLKSYSQMESLGELQEWKSQSREVQNC